MAARALRVGGARSAIVAEAITAAARAIGGDGWDIGRFRARRRAFVLPARERRAGAAGGAAAIETAPSVGTEDIELLARPGAAEHVAGVNVGACDLQAIAR